MLAAANWLGWAYAEEWGIVFRFESDYASRESVRANVARCASDHLAADVFIDRLHIYSSDETERCSEDAEAAALDLPAGWMGEDGHAALVDIEVTAPGRTGESAVKAYAHGVGMPEVIALDMMGAFADAAGALDDGAAADEFIRFLATMRRRAGLAA